MCVAVPASAQTPAPAPTSTPTLPRDTPIVGGDTVAGDSSARARRVADSLTQADTIVTDSERPVLPPLTPPGPIMRGGRWVFDEDALHFLGALDLGELLAHIPGVMLVRGGWYGQTEEVAYAGQGAASVEVYWDGYRMDPLGVDSSAIDLARVPIGLARRVEVEVLPTVLRVYLVSDVGTVRRPLTETAFATGDATTNTYLIRYQNRWAPGTGLALGVNWFGTDGPSTTPGHVADLTTWAKVTWTPSPLVGVEVQYLTYAASHDSLIPQFSSGPAIPGAHDTRRDLFVRGHIGSSADVNGMSFDAILGGTTYNDSLGIQRSISQAAAIGTFRRASLSSSLTLRLRDAVVPLEVEARTGWTPRPFLTVSGFLRSSSLDGGRTSNEADASAGLTAGRFALHGSVRWRNAVAEPDVIADTAQTVSDVSGGVSFLSRAVFLDASVERHGWFTAPTWNVFDRQLPQLTSIDVTTFTTSFRVAPWRYLYFSGWYRTPLDPIQAAYEPPNHSNIAVTFRSRMLPRLRRGVFDLSLSASLEGWSDGVAAFDSSGNEIRLLGATSYNYSVEIRLVDAVLYWTMRNAGASRFSLVPGFQQGRALQRYGIRWEFTN